MQEVIQETREEKFSKHQFEWVKTERAGDVSKFQRFEYENDVEYTVFDDNSRIRTELLGDIVLMHSFDGEILGRELLVPQTIQAPLVDHFSESRNILPEEVFQKPKPTSTSQDPVVSILEKTKKRNEKITLTLNVKIPSPELYNVVRENFENVDDILLENVMEQIHENLLRESLKKELQNIYSAKKKKA